MGWLLLVSGVANAGKYGADFLEIGAGARYPGMGSASVASAQGAMAGYWNPAGVVATRRFSAFAMQVPRFHGIQTYQNLGLAWPARFGCVGLTWIRLSIDDIPIYPELEGTHERRLADRSLQPSPEPEGFMADVENALLLSYAFDIPNEWRVARRRVHFNVGGSLKYLSQRFGGHRAYGIGVDLGMQARVTGGGHPIAVGLVIQDAYTTTLHWNTESKHEDVIQGNIRLGIAYRPERGFWKHFTVSGEMHTRYGPVFHLGVESDHLKWVLLRAGLNGTHPTFGVGLRLAGFSVDYALTTHDLESVHQVSAAVAW